MTDPQLDLTSQLGSTLRALDTLIEGELRPEIAEAVAVARRMLATSREPFGWRFIDLGARTLPEGIRSGAVFVLPAGPGPVRRGNRATVAGHPARRRAPAGGLAGGRTGCPVVPHGSGARPAGGQRGRGAHLHGPGGGLSL